MKPKRYTNWFGGMILLFVCHAHSQDQKSAISSDPFQQGLFELQENHPDAALEAFSLAESMRPKDARVRNFRAIALTSLGRTEEAVAEYHRAIELDPKFENAYRNLGFLEWNVHQNDSAKLHLEKALALDSNDEFSRYYLARIEADGGRYAKALPLFEQMANAGHEDRPWARVNLALGYLNAGKYEDAIGTLRTLSGREKEGSPYSALAYSIIGIASARLGRRDQSIEALRRAAALAPQQEEVWLNLTRQLMDANRLSEAIEATQDGLRSSPKSYALRLRLGAAYFSSGKYTEAEQAFRELVNAGDPLPMSYVGLAQVLLHTGRAGDAAAQLAEAEKKLGPEFLLTYFRGLALSRTGQRAEALAAFREAVQVNPANSEAHLGCGKTALALGDVSQAIKELQRVLELDPGNVPARRLLGQAYARSGDRDNAVKYATSAPDTELEPRTNLVGDFILPEWQQPVIP